MTKNGTNLRALNHKSVITSLDRARVGFRLIEMLKMRASILNLMPMQGMKGIYSV
jgi:hypothetical protein